MGREIVPRRPVGEQRPPGLLFPPEGPHRRRLAARHRIPGYPGFLFPPEGPHRVGPDLQSPATLVM